MIDEKAVSLWAGWAASREVLELNLATSYSEDGDFLGSRFSRAFKIDYFDEDLLEAEVLDNDATTIAAALKGCSSDIKVIQEFEKLLGLTFVGPVNSIVLLYNFHYDGDIEFWTDGDISLKFFGTVNYR
jgi:hypothetical protein